MKKDKKQIKRSEPGKQKRKIKNKEHDPMKKNNKQNERSEIPDAKRTGRTKNKVQSTKNMIEYSDNTSEPGMVCDDGSVYQTQQPLTFEKVWLMFQETDKKFQETDKKVQETDKQIKETDRIVRGISKEIGGIGNNIGEVTEDYFRGALLKMKEFAGVKIEYVTSLSKRSKTLEGEYDIVVFGKDTLIVVEVKHKLTRNHVEQFINNSLPTFIAVCPEYSGYKILGAVAGMTAQKSAIKLAISKGLYVITPSGQKIALLNSEDFEPKQFQGK